MLEFKGKNSQKHYEPYDKVLSKQCTYIGSETLTESLTKIGYNIDRYLCPCGMVKVSKGPGYRIKIESDVCGFR